MLRWVRLASRQHLEHLAIFTAYSDTLLRTPYPLIYVRWAATSAVITPKRRHPSTKAKSERPDLTFVKRVPQNLTSGKSRSFTDSSHISPTTLSMMDKLLSSAIDEQTALNQIRRSSHLYMHLKDGEKARKLAEALACTQSPLKALGVLTLAHALGTSLKQNAYECVSFQLANQRHWHGVLSTVSLGKQQTGRTTSRLLNWHARALVELRDFSTLQYILDEFKKHSLSPTRRTFHLILSGHIQNRNILMARQCLLTMTKMGTPPDASTHAIVATYYRALGVDPHVQTRSLESLSDLKSHTATAVVNSLIRLHLDARDLPGALNLLSLFNRNDVDVIFSVLSGDGVLKNTMGHVQLYPSTFPSSTRRNLAPNAATFSVFMDYLATQFDVPGALRILKGMIAAGVAPTCETVTSLIHVFFSARRDNLAVHLVAGMCDPKRTPFSMFEPILLPHSKELIPWIPSGLSPTTRVFNALLRGILRTCGLQGMQTILDIMHSSNIKPDATTLQILMAHLSRTERTDPTVLLHVLRMFSSFELQPTLRHMHIILSCVMRHEKYLLYRNGWNAKAVNFSSSRQASHNHPERRYLRLAKASDPTAGIRLSLALHKHIARGSLWSLSSRKTLSDPAMLALRIRHDAVIQSDADAAKEVFHLLVNRGMCPNEYHFSALMEGLAQSGDLEGAFKVLKSAEQAGIRPNVVMFTILIVGYARQGDPDMAIHAFQQMISTNIKPDVPSIDAVSSAFFTVGAYAMARKVLISLWPHIQPFPEELREASLKDLVRSFRLLHHTHRGYLKGPTAPERLQLHLKLCELREAWQKRSISR